MAPNKANKILQRNPVLGSKKLLINIAKILAGATYIYARLRFDPKVSFTLNAKSVILEANTIPPTDNKKSVRISASFLLL